MSPRDLFTATGEEIEALERAIEIAAAKTNLSSPLSYTMVEIAVLRAAYSGQAIVGGVLDPECLAAMACCYLKDKAQEAEQNLSRKRWLDAATLQSS